MMITLKNPLSRTIDFNFDWMFNLEDNAGYSAYELDTREWRSLRLPHDWSVEASFDAENGDGATAYLPGGTGWYRKHFTTDHTDDQLVFLLFDGIYNHSEVWCNGQSLGYHPYGYSPFWFDLTPHLKRGADHQVIAVRVDRSRYIDSRWYTGSGIYRNVKLITKSRLHIPIWGTRLTTPEITADSARVELEVTLKNAFTDARVGVVRTEIFAPDGVPVATVETPFKMESNQGATITQSATVSAPDLWGLEHPNLYRAVTSVISDEQTHDVYETSFGIRSCVFDPDAGFFLNGKNTLIKGVCLHHDGGLVGSAVPDGVWRRRLLALKDLGCNAIRMSHNPSAEALLNLCDELGFLVQAEFFDEWDLPKDKRLNGIERHDDYISRGYAEYFHEWAESDLKRTMLRDRNHPCIFQWSIGNEIEWTFKEYAKATGYFEPEFEGNYFFVRPPYSWDQIKARYDALPKPEYPLEETAHKLAQWTREMDTTRPITANCILPSTSHVTGYTDALDVVGYSYRRVIYDGGHAFCPDKAIMGTENVGQWHEWKAVLERPFISGMFIWTGINYMGEAHDQWPAKGFDSGLIDQTGFFRASGHMFKTLWVDDPALHIATQTLEKSPYQVNEAGEMVEKVPGGWERRGWVWHEVNAHWNYAGDTPVAVEIYTNCSEVELFLNGQSLGRRTLHAQDDRIMKWVVPFAAGDLKAVGITGDGREVVTTIESAGAPAGIMLSCDKTRLHADAYDVAHITAQVVDAQGIPVRHVEHEIVFTVDGACRMMGVDNGAIDNVQGFQSDRLTTSQGRALLILQAEKEAGLVTVKAESGAIESAPIEIEIAISEA